MHTLKPEKQICNTMIKTSTQKKKHWLKLKKHFVLFFSTNLYWNSASSRFFRVQLSVISGQKGKKKWKATVHKQMNNRQYNPNDVVLCLCWFKIFQPC